MRLLILSDIHGNHPALTALKAGVFSTPSLSYDCVVCLGDILGYYGRPAESWRLLQDMLGKDGYLMPGNHDLAVVFWDEAREFQLVDRGVLSLAMHREILRNQHPDIWEALTQLTRQSQHPQELTKGKYRLVFTHGTTAPTHFGSAATAPDIFSLKSPYLQPGGEGARHLREMLEHAQDQFPPPFGGKTLVFFGHTHMPVLAYLGSEGHLMYADANYCADTQDIPLHEHPQLRDAKVIAVNGGSIGQPRDGVGATPKGQARTHAAHFDSDQGILTFISIPYNFSNTEKSTLQMLPSQHLQDLRSAKGVQALLTKSVEASNIQSTVNPNVFMNMQAYYPVLSQFTSYEQFNRFVLYEEINASSVQTFFLQAMDFLWQEKIYPQLYGFVMDFNQDRAEKKYDYHYTLEGFQVKRGKR